MTFLHAFQKFVTVFDYSGLYHFPEQVIAFPGTFADSGEDGESVVLFGYIVYEFLYQDGLAYSCTSEQSDFTAFEVRFQQVNDLDSGEKHFLGGGEVLEFRRLPVDRKRSAAVKFAHTVDDVPRHVHYPSPYLGADRHGDRGGSVGHFHTALESVRTVHGDGPDGVFSYVLLDFEDEFFPILFPDGQCIVYAWQGFCDIFSRNVEVYVHHRSDYL